MAAMTTVLTDFSQNGNSRTRTTTGHSASKCKLVIEKRRVPEGNQNMVEYEAKVIQATEDDNGVVLAQKVALGVNVRYPKEGQSAEIAAALVILKDIVASDDFANSVTTTEWL